MSNPRGLDPESSSLLKLHGRVDLLLLLRGIPISNLLKSNSWFSEFLKQLLGTAGESFGSFRCYLNLSFSKEMGFIWTLFELLSIFVSVLSLGLGAAVVFSTFRRKHNHEYDLYPIRLWILFHFFCSFNVFGFSILVVTLRRPLSSRIQIRWSRYASEL